jgi:hypothetical protein
MQREIETLEKARSDFSKERETNNQILRLSKDEISHLQKMLEEVEMTLGSDSLHVLRDKQAQ